METLVIIIIGIACLSGILYTIYSKGPSVPINQKIDKDAAVASFVKEKTERELLEQQVVLLLEISKQTRRTAKNTAFITWSILISIALTVLITIKGF